MNDTEFWDYMRERSLREREMAALLRETSILLRRYTELSSKLAGDELEFVMRIEQEGLEVKK